MSHGFIQLPPDSTGKRLHTSKHTVDGQEVHNQMFVLSDPLVPQNQQSVDNEGQAYMRFAEGAPMFDAFGKMKVSQEEHLNSFISYVDTLDRKGFIEEVEASVTHAASRSGHLFTTNTDSDAIARWTTNKRFFYNVGTGMYVLSTLNIGDIGKEHVVRRWGLYDDSDGIYFELDGTTLYTVVRNSSSGTVVNTRIAQADWNRDKLDGSGLSGTVIDITKVNIYWIDFQWLGAGRVRFGVVDDNGYRITCNEFRNANHNTTLYMANSVLPYRVEQFNSDTALSLSQMYFYNMGVVADGEFELPVIYKSGAMPGLIEIPPNVDIPIWSLRAKQTHLGKPNHQIILPASLALYAAENPVLFYLLKNATLTGATWNYDLGADSIGEGDVTTTAVTGGSIVYAVICSPGFSQHIDLVDKFKYEMSMEYIKVNANGVSDHYTLMAKAFTAATNIYPLMSWRESVS